MMRRYNKFLISYESEECINLLLASKQTESLEELKDIISKVMKARKVYKYQIHYVKEISKEEHDKIQKCKDIKEVI